MIPHYAPTLASTHQHLINMASSFSATSEEQRLLPLSIISSKVSLSFQNPPETGPGYYVDWMVPGDNVASNPELTSRCKLGLDRLSADISGIPFSLQRGTIIRGRFGGEEGVSGIVAFDGDVSLG